MITFKQFINEHLSDSQQETVDSQKLDTSEGKHNFKGIIPEGQTHTEIPIQNPLALKINEHLRKTPVLDKAGNILGTYKRHETDPKLVVHPDGRNVKLSGVLKNNPALAKEFAEVGSRASAERTDTRWTAPAIDPTQKKIVISNHPHAIFGKSEGKPWRSCADWGHGYASDNLHDDVEVGGGVAYLTHKDEPTPNNPSRATGRVAIHPYHAIDAAGDWITDKEGGPVHTVLRASSKRYGEDDAHESFHKTVAQHLEEKHPLIHSRYRLNPSVYQGDDANNDILDKPLTHEDKKPFVDNLEFGIKHGFVPADDVAHAIHHNYLTPEHINAIVKNPINTGAHYELAKGNRDFWDRGKNQKKVNLTDDNINVLAKHGNSLVTDELADLHKRNGNVPDEALNHMAKNPSLSSTHPKLASAFLDNKHLPEEAIKAIASYKGSAYSHYYLASAHANGSKLPEEAIHSMINNPDSQYAHKELVDGHLHGHSIPQESINTLSKYGDNASHGGIVKAYIAGKKVSNEAVDNIAQDPLSNTSHLLLANAHREEKIKLSDKALTAISGHPFSASAQESLYQAHKNGNKLPAEAVTKLAMRGFKE